MSCSTLSTAKLTILISALSLGLVHGQANRSVSKVGTTAATLLEFGIGSRALAMGDAYVSRAGDISASYWNPAGLADLPGTEIAFYQTPWVANIELTNTVIGFPAGRLGTVALFITSLTMDEMRVRTVEKPEGTGEMFGANSIVLGTSYARSLTDRFRFGANFKLITEHIWHMSSSRVAFDIGTLFTTGNRGINIGMSISNFGSKMRLEGRDTQRNIDIDESKSGNNDRIAANLETWEWPLPLIFRVGVSTPPIQIGANRLILATDAIQPNNQRQYMNVGLEYSWHEIVYLRVGQPEMFLEDSQKGLTVGGGIHYRSAGNFTINLDYVSRDIGILGIVDGYTLGISF